MPKHRVLLSGNVALNSPRKIVREKHSLKTQHIFLIINPFTPTNTQVLLIDILVAFDAYFIHLNSIILK